MEIKFDHAIPTWIREITVAHHLRLQRFSKYASSIEALNLAATSPSRKIRTVESFEQSLDNDQAEASHPEPRRESSTRELAAKAGG